MKGYTTQETILPWDMGMKSQEGDSLLHIAVFKTHKHVLYYKDPSSL